MGQHSVPRRYLRNFELSGHPNCIWLYDKNGSRPRVANISKVAQQRSFYDPAVERELAEGVEQPANKVIQKLRDGRLLSESERRELALYLAVMLMRVQERRKRATAMLPGVLDSVIKRAREDIVAVGISSDIEQSVIERILARLEVLHATYAADPPDVVRNRIKSPWPPKAIFEILYEMTWRVLKSSGPSFFLTSDNPAFFFLGLGLGTPEAEFCMPLSTTHAIHASWQTAPEKLVFIEELQPVVKEINRRIASAATRFVFYHEHTEWIQVLLGKEDPRLTRIRWRTK